MNPHYNQNYTKEEIDAVLNHIKSCIKKNHYTISLNENRQENIDFINEYNIRSDKQKSILMQIRTEDFCADGKEEVIDVYIKFNILNLPSGSRTVIISFHKRNKPVNYPFR